MLVGPWVPFPKIDASVRAKLFLIVDDHSRLLVDGRFFAHENARACQELLRRAITRRGVPDVLYADNGAPFSNAWLSRTCAVLGVRLVHSKPYSPEGRGKQERLNRYIREAFLSEATHQGIASLEELNDLFFAWAEQVANRRVHAETNEAPIERFERTGPHRQVDPDQLREAFRWSVTRKVTRTATVPLEGNSYGVDPALVGRRVELRYDPEDLSRIDVYLNGTRPGWRRRSSSRRHTHRAVPQAARAKPVPTGIDYLDMVATAHEESAGTGQKIDFSQLAMFETSTRRRAREPGTVGRPLRSRRGPLSASPSPPRTCSSARPTKKPSPASTSASSSPPSAWSPVTSARERRSRCERPSPRSTRPVTRSSTSPTRPLARGGSTSRSCGRSVPSRGT